MHRKPLLNALDAYEQVYPHEKTVALMRAFALSTTECFKRENLEGHFTASAFVLSKDKKRLLLTHHAKLKKWLQLGGHADGETLLHEVALREAREEGGVEHLTFLESNPIDLDIHEIPAHKGVPAHLHYDVRYLLRCDDEERIVISDESLALEWIPLEKISLYTQEVSLLRVIKKISYQ